MTFEGESRRRSVSARFFSGLGGRNHSSRHHLMAPSSQRKLSTSQRGGISAATLYFDFSPAKAPKPPRPGLSDLYVYPARHTAFRPLPEGGAETAEAGL